MAIAERVIGAWVISPIGPALGTKKVTRMASEATGTQRGTVRARSNPTACVAVPRATRITPGMATPYNLGSSFRRASTPVPAAVPRDGSVAT